MCYPSTSLCSPSSLPRILHRAFIPLVYLSLDFSVGLCEFVVCVSFCVYAIPVCLFFCLFICVPFCLSVSALCYLSLILLFCVFLPWLVCMFLVYSFPLLLIVLGFPVLFARPSLCCSSIFWFLCYMFIRFPGFDPCLCSRYSDFGSPLYWTFCYTDLCLFMTTILPAPNKYLSLSLLCASGSLPFTFPSRIITKRPVTEQIMLVFVNSKAVNLLKNTVTDKSLAAYPFCRNNC